jgi:D-3-phosphoglycerate dehydrogenase
MTALPAQTNVLIIDEMHPSLHSLLAEHGFEADYQPDILTEDVPDALAAYEVLIVRSKLKLNRHTLAKATNLKVIARAGAGLDNIDLEFVQAKGIQVVHAAEGNQQAVAEHTIGLILAMLNHFVRSDKQIRNGEWKREFNRGVELGSLTVGVMGCGYMGSRVVDLLSAFGFKILVYDKYKPALTIGGAERCTLDQLQAEVDLLSIHLPLTQETYSLVDDNFINGFAKPFYLVNTARGEVVQLAALVNGLKSGQLLGLAVDVLENEKLQYLSPGQAESFLYLKDSDKVIFTPHVAGWTYQSYQRINEVLVDKLVKALR